MRKLVHILTILCSMCIVLHAQGWSDAHSVQDAYARVAEKAFPAVVVVINYRQGAFGRLAEAESGSGFFVRADGLLVTNHHVIDGAKVLGVRLADGSLHPAVVVGTSRETDIAVLKVDVERKVPFLKFADTSTVKVGHHAIAIGAPLSLSHTMTTGIVSFKGRKLGVNNNEEFIQTDASINPGNSGGPLLNIDGLVIGVNDCGIMPNGSGSIGLNFAINASLAQRTLGILLSRGLMERPHLGITIENTWPEGNGVVVTEVMRRSPAEAAGLKVGDVIRKVGKTEVKDIFLLQALVLTSYSTGDKVEIEVERKGERKCLTITCK